MACLTSTNKPLKAGELSLNVLTQGCGTKKILFLHGFPEFSWFWQPVMTGLAPDHVLFAPDQRGYAPSPIPADVSSYATAKIVDDAADLIKTIDPAGFVVVGHDWGGIIAWSLASRYPALVKGLVIINGPHPDVFARELANDPAQVQASMYFNLLLSPSIETQLAMNDYEQLAAIYKDMPADFVAHFRKAIAPQGTLTGALNWYRANLTDGHTPGPTFPTNVHVDVPTLVLWGMKDTALVSGNLDGLSDYVSNLQIQKIPDAGHSPMLETPDVVISAVQTFTASVE